LSRSDFVPQRNGSFIFWLNTDGLWAAPGVEIDGAYLGKGDELIDHWIGSNFVKMGKELNKKLFDIFIDSCPPCT